MEIKSIAHAKVRVRYHIIFSTKYRKKVLNGIEASVYEAFREAEAHSSFKIHEMGIDGGDHIHLIVSFRPRYSIEQVVRRLKQLSLKNIYEREEEHLRKFYWGERRRLWTNGYFVGTIGETTEEATIKYIKNQAKH